MRTCIGVGVALLAGPAYALSPGDDPKCARGECRPSYAAPLDTDDPKLSLGTKRERPVAHLDMSYRYLVLRDPYGGGLPFHVAELDGFPISRYVRLGISLTGGAATRESAYLVDLGFGLGVQYPWRVTPFLDVKFAAGVVGATIEGHKLASYEYRPTVEAGFEVFVARSFHATVAVGYSHPVYGGVDANVIKAAIAAHESPKYDVHNMSWDTVTVRAGVGF